MRASAWRIAEVCHNPLNYSFLAVLRRYAAKNTRQSAG
jgi:hypothetical protein